MYACNLTTLEPSHFINCNLRTFH